MTRRVDRLVVDQACVDHAAHLDQLLPVPAITGEARDLTRTDSSDLAETDLCDNPLEAGALTSARRRAAEIIIDHFDLGPAERRQAVPHGVLQRTALAVVQDLMGRRLPYIKQRLALQMMRTDLLRHHGWPPSGRRSGACRDAPGSAALSSWLARLVSPPEGPARGAR